MLLPITQKPLAFAHLLNITVKIDQTWTFTELVGQLTQLWL